MTKGFQTGFFLVAFIPSILFAQSDILILQSDDKKPAPSTNDLTITQEKEEERTSPGFHVFYEKWRMFETASGRSDRAGAEAAMKELVDLKRSRNLPALPEFAKAAVQAADSKLKENDFEGALLYFRAAAELDPSLSDAYYGQAKTHFSTGVKGYIPGTIAGVQGFLAPRHSILGRIYLYGKVIFILVTTILCLAVIFAIVLLLKYNHLLRHDAEERFGSRFDAAVIHFAVFVLLFLPVLTLFGPFWLIPFWLAVFIPYGKRSERVLSVFFILVIAFAYPVLQDMFRYSVAANQPATAAYINAISGAPTPKNVHDFEQYASSHPADLDAKILLAYLYKSDGLNEKATDLLQKHMLEYPSDSRAPNNLAVIYFQQGETEYALRLAQKAAVLAPGNAIYKYNLSKMSRAKFNFSEAEKLMSEARAIDVSLVSNLESNSAQNLADDIPNYGYVWKRISTSESIRIAGLINPFTIAGGVLLVIAILFAARASEKSRARQCVKCGKAFCKKCQSSTRAYGFCTQCLHIFVKKDGVSPTSRKEKMQEIDYHSKRQKWFQLASSLLLPGTAGLFQDRTVKGILLLMIWILCIVAMYFTKKYAPLSTFESPYYSGFLVGLCTVVMAAVYIFANARLVKRAVHI